MTEITGLIAYGIAVLIGVSLGLIGAGGAIVAVPLFVYVLKIPPTRASGYALFVVGVSSLIAVLQHMRDRAVNWREAVAFGTSTMLTVYLVRTMVMPLVPSTFNVAGLVVQRDHALMIAFALVLLGAAYGMMRKPAAHQSNAPAHIALLPVYGVVIGIISGFLGVGGGFLMTPALVLWGKLDMKRAVATSLVLICANSCIGVLADMRAGLWYDWPFVLTFTGCTTVGIVVGMLLARRLDGSQLRSGFGWFVLVLGVAVLVRELLFSAS